MDTTVWMAGMSGPTVTRIGPGTLRVEIDGRSALVYVASVGATRWGWCNGQLIVDDGRSSRSASKAQRSDVLEPILSPMPAHVLKVTTAVGGRVSKDDIVIVLEAMKMELPLRAGADGIVKAIHCREGALVGPDEVLIEFEPGTTA